jgi:hypothetical protein
MGGCFELLHVPQFDCCACLGWGYITFCDVVANTLPCTFTGLTLSKVFIFDDIVIFYKTLKNGYGPLYAHSQFIPNMFLLLLYNSFPVN